jgi:hypothetical protein
MISFLRLLALYALLVASPARADDLASFTGVEVDTLRGAIVPRLPNKAALATVFDSIAPAFRPYAEGAAQALGEAIRSTRERAAATSQPIPAGVRQALQPYFPPDALDRIRWTIADPNRLSLVSVMAINKDVEGLTLDEVVVFGSCQLARTRLDLWAHELVHVMQYRAMGVDDFARVYLASAGNSLEKQAYDWQAYVAEKLRAARVTIPPFSPSDPLPPGC